LSSAVPPYKPPCSAVQERSNTPPPWLACTKFGRALWSQARLVQRRGVGSRCVWLGMLRFVRSAFLAGGQRSLGPPPSAEDSRRGSGGHPSLSSSPPPNPGADRYAQVCLGTWRKSCRRLGLQLEGARQLHDQPWPGIQGRVDCRPTQQPPSLKLRRSRGYFPPGAPLVGRPGTPLLWPLAHLNGGSVGEI